MVHLKRASLEADEESGSVVGLKRFSARPYLAILSTISS